jgi:hypothetical protein
MSFKVFSNDELVLEAEREIKTERGSTLRIIKLFQEIYDRKIYLERGYKSFYEMVTKHFGYCDGSAMRRINAMKLVRELPQVAKKIESGELSLSVAADVQSFLYQEAKIERPYSTTAKIELVETCLGKTRKEAELEFVRRNPERERRESVHAISHDRLRVSFSISKELNDKLNYLKDLLSHGDPTMTTESLLDRLAELGLDKHDPQRKAARAKERKAKQVREFEERMKKSSVMEAEAKDLLKKSSSAVAETNDVVSVKEGRTADTEIGAQAAKTQKSTSAAEVRTRYIPAEEKHQVPYDGKGCVFEVNGRRCGSTRFLQLDHVIPFAQSGANTAANLRWMCGAHNRWRTESHRCR